MDGKERGRRMSITQEEFNDLLKLHLSINPLRETYAKLYAYKAMALKTFCYDTIENRDIMKNFGIYFIDLKGKI